MKETSKQKERNIRTLQKERKNHQERETERKGNLSKKERLLNTQRNKRKE